MAIIAPSASTIRRMDAFYCEIDWPPESAGEGLRGAFRDPAEVLVAWRPDEVADLLGRAEALAARHDGIAHGLGDTGFGPFGARQQRIKHRLDG